MSQKKGISLKGLSVLADVCGIISFIVPVACSLLGYFNKDLSLGLWGGVLAFAVFFILGGVILCRKTIAKWMLKKVMNLSCPDKMYKLKHKEVVYEFVNRFEMRHEKFFDVEPLHDGFSEITDKFKWSGSSSLTPKSIFSGQEIESLSDHFGMQRYKLKFSESRGYSKHDRVPKMGMVIDNIKDPDQKSALLLSSGIFCITDRLTLRVVLSNDLNPENIRFLEYIHYSDDEHYSCQSGTCVYNNDTNKKEIVWEITNPFFGGRYMIDWSFKK